MIVCESSVNEDLAGINSFQSCPQQLWISL